MQTNLSEAAHQLPGADVAEEVLRTCVCGFNATCPTYQLLGDELDGPRGHLPDEADAGSAKLRQHAPHLDRCLTCRNCETTCPSGAIPQRRRGRRSSWAPRPLGERLQRDALRAVAAPGRLQGRPARQRAVRPLLRFDRGAASHSAAGARPAPACAPRADAGRLRAAALSPNTNAATARVLEHPAQHRPGGTGRLLRREVSTQRAGGRTRSCAPQHRCLVAGDRARRSHRADGQRQWRLREGVRLPLRDDPAYAAKAKRVSELALDLVEVLRAEPLETLGAKTGARLAFHCPCTLQHAQKLGGAVEAVLARLGFNLTAVPDSHLCCGSAGTYSLTQPELSRRLRDNKLDALESGKPDVIATANIGCQTHLDGAGRTSVRHWIELVDEAIA